MASRPYLESSNVPFGIASNSISTLPSAFSTLSPRVDLNIPTFPNAEPDLLLKVSLPLRTTR